MMTKGYFKIFFIAQIAELINFAKKDRFLGVRAFPLFFLSVFTPQHIRAYFV